MTADIRTRCERCGKQSNCVAFGDNKPIQLCETCIGLIVSEWTISFDGFGELAAS